ncbi:DUF3784 domain-containing protein [Clostridium septicum]|uniref:DUF3784 domain-containing protein n=1 Tax=Clostridium septicum TaxID=1504 RepID=UPI00083122BF|nr:DUF3784 domain-containing protein [Clostridium septicum]MDU1314819.1 DUF3784 domain-containing protein [Clostridium septicum]
MKPADLTGILVFAFLAGGILTFLGSIIKFFNAGDILNFFDESKHDKDKVSKIVGKDLLTIGVSVIIIAIIGIFINEKYYNFIMISQAAIVILGLVITIYHQFFKCKKDN